jgi:hypothetical protein
MQPLKTAEDVLRFFRENETPIFYVSTTTYNMINLYNFINDIALINSVDSFDGRHPDIFVPALSPADGPARIEAANNLLLSLLEVVDYVQRWGPGGKVLFMMFDEETERLAEALGLEVCFPPAALRHHLDSKVAATRLATEAGVASVPHVLARVRGYEHLRAIARDLGPDLVVQLPHGDSGATTFFISSAADYRRHARAIAQAREVKVMRRIPCRPLTVEGCITRHGTLVGPLMTELVGFPTLTPFRGGWCGNELVGDALDADLRLRARRATEALGRRLKRAGYRGYFGLDYLLDDDTGNLYLGELNPRITGITTLTSQAARDAGEVPLFLYHLLEWLGVDYRVDVTRYNDLWVDPARAVGWGQLIIDHTEVTDEVVTDVPPSGIYRLTPDGTIGFSRREYLPGAVRDEAEAMALAHGLAGSSPAAAS